MNSVLNWGAYFIRQATYAFTVVAGILLLAEILLPGSVLPFFNLHALVFAVLALHLMVISLPTDERAHVALRLAVLIPAFLLLAAAVLLTIWGESASSMLLSAAFVVVMIGIVVATIKSPT